jgi:hypothetical protein
LSANPIDEADLPSSISSGTFLENDVNLMAFCDAQSETIKQCQAVSWQPREV